MDENTKCYFAFIVVSRWLGLRLDGLTTVFLCTAITLTLFLLEFNITNIPTDLLGLGLTYVISLGDQFQWGTRQSCELENMFVSVERLLEYAQLEPEAPKKTENDKHLPKNWPENGKIELRNFKAKYREGMDNVLKGIDLTIEGGCKIGIGKFTLLVGRRHFVNDEVSEANEEFTKCRKPVSKHCSRKIFTGTFTGTLKGKSLRPII
eukprot:g3682.t1